MKRLVACIPFVAILTCGALTSWGTASKSMLKQKLPALKLEYVSKTPETAGKPMIVEFWATWCGPCRTSIPHLNQIYKKYQDKGLIVIGVTDEDSQTINKFTKQVPMDYFPATDKDGSLSKAFGIQGIPHAVLVDKTGTIVWEGHPMELKETEIEKVL